MKIASLQDWLSFADEVAAPARELLRDFGVADADMSTFASFEASKSAATHAEFMAGKGDPTRLRAACGVVVLVDRIKRAAARVESEPSAAAGSLAALAWRLHMVASGLYRYDVEPAFESVRNRKAGSWKRQPALWKRGFRSLLKRTPEITAAELLDAIDADGHITIDDDDIKLVRAGAAVVVVDLKTGKKSAPIAETSLRAYLARAKKP